MQLGIISTAAQCIITYCSVCDPLLLSMLSCFISFINKFHCCEMLQYGFHCHVEPQGIAEARTKM